MGGWGRDTHSSLLQALRPVLTPAAVCPITKAQQRHPPGAEVALPKPVRSFPTARLVQRGERWPRAEPLQSVTSSSSTTLHRLGTANPAPLGLNTVFSPVAQVAEPGHRPAASER